MPRDLRQASAIAVGGWGFGVLVFRVFPFDEPRGKFDSGACGLELMSFRNLRPQGSHEFGLRLLQVQTS